MPNQPTSDTCIFYVPKEEDFFFLFFVCFCFFVVFFFFFFLKSPNKQKLQEKSQKKWEPVYLAACHVSSERNQDTLDRTIGFPLHSEIGVSIGSFQEVIQFVPCSHPTNSCCGLVQETQDPTYNGCVSQCCDMLKTRTALKDKIDQTSKTWH